MKKYWYIILPSIIFVVFSLDLFVTIYSARTFKNFEEANPIALYVWDNYGTDGLVVFKIAVVFVSCACNGIVLCGPNKKYILFTTIFGLLACVVICGWWLFWFILQQPAWFHV